MPFCLPRDSRTGDSASPARPHPATRLCQLTFLGIGDGLLNCGRLCSSDINVNCSEPVLSHARSIIPTRHRAGCCSSSRVFGRAPTKSFLFGGLVAFPWRSSREETLSQLNELFGSDDLFRCLITTQARAGIVIADIPALLSFNQIAVESLADSPLPFLINAACSDVKSRLPRCGCSIAAAFAPLSSV